MGPLLQIGSRHLYMPKVSRRNLHQLSTATAFYRKSELLSPSSSFVSTNSSRCFSEAILKSNFVSTVSDKVTQNDVVHVVQEKLITIHDISGLPWWAVIVTSTIALRTLLIFPFAIHQQRVLAKLTNVHKETVTTVEGEVSQTITQLSKKHRWDAESSNLNYHSEMYDRRQELYQKHKCKPSKTLLLIFIQVPVWTTMSGAIYNINYMLPLRDAVATQAHFDMKATAFSILTDLTVPDETYLLPLLLVFTNLIIVQLKEMSVLPSRNNFRALGLILWRGISIGSFPFIIFAPKCMTLYWLTSSFVGLLQNILFVHPKTREILRIPQTDSMNKKPFARLKNSLKSIYYFFRY